MRHRDPLKALRLAAHLCRARCCLLRGRFVGHGVSCKAAHPSCLRTTAQRKHIGRSSVVFWTGIMTLDASKSTSKGSGPWHWQCLCGKDLRARCGAAVMPSTKGTRKLSATICFVMVTREMRSLCVLVAATWDGADFGGGGYFGRTSCLTFVMQTTLSICLPVILKIQNGCTTGVPKHADHARSS